MLDREVGAKNLHPINRGETMTWWKCSNCGYVFEADKDPERCPNCGEKCTFYGVSCYTPECGF